MLPSLELPFTDVVGVVFYVLVLITDTVSDVAAVLVDNVVAVVDVVVVFVAVVVVVVVQVAELVTR